MAPWWQIRDIGIPSDELFNMASIRREWLDLVLYHHRVYVNLFPDEWLHLI